MDTELISVGFADDDASVRALLNHVLGTLNYRVSGGAENGTGAIDIVTRLHPQIMLMDHHMPGNESLEASKSILALGTTAVVMLTFEDKKDQILEAVKLGVSGYVRKPFNPGQLRASLELSWHRFKILADIQKDYNSLKQQLEMRKLTERAKGILMEQQGLAEDEAHRTLLKLSQDQGLPLADICRSLIQVRDVLGKARRPSRK